jgi:hypothetical protein
MSEGLERTVAGAGDGAAVTTVVEERVDRFLQHALFVADDDFRRLELQQVLETVVAVDDAAIEIVQIGRRETAAFERNERTQVRRDHGQHRRGSSTPDGSSSCMEALGSLRRLASFFGSACSGLAVMPLRGRPT